MSEAPSVAYLPVTIDEDGVWWIRGNLHHVWMQQRPAYCDRGHYIAHVEPAPDAGIAYSIDSSDRWPRYYMDRGRMFDEVRDWIDWREGDGPKTEGQRVFGGRD